MNDAHCKISEEGSPPPSWLTGWQGIIGLEFEISAHGWHWVRVSSKGVCGVPEFVGTWRGIIKKGKDGNRK